MIDASASHDLVFEEDEEWFYCAADGIIFGGGGGAAELEDQLVHMIMVVV